MLCLCRMEELLCKFSANFLRFLTPDMCHTKHTGMTSRALITGTWRLVCKLGLPRYIAAMPRFLPVRFSSPPNVDGAARS